MKEFTLVWSQDPALKRPEHPPDATDDDKRAADAEFDRAFKVATETSRWESLVREGQRLTTYRFAMPSRTEVTWWQGEIREFSISAANDLLIQISLRGIEYGSMFSKIAEPPKVKRTNIAKHLGHIIWAVDSDVIDAIDEAAKPLPSPLVELGDALFTMLRDRIRPLS